MSSRSNRALRSAAGVLGPLALLGAIAFVHAFFLNRGDTPAQGEHLFALGFLMLAGEVGGRLARSLGAPQLTGYLIAGMIAGPHGIALFSTDTLDALMLVNDLALALIALQAGAELTTEMLQRSARSILSSILAQTAILPLLACVSFCALAESFDFLRDLDLTQLVALGFVWGSIMLSKSPAATLAVLGETKARGPLTEHTLGVVVALDVVVLIVFPIALTAARSALSGGDLFSFAALEHLPLELFASVAAGTTFGLLIALFFRLVSRGRMLFLVVIGFGVSELCRELRYDTLLVFVFAGAVVANLTRQSRELLATSEQLAAAVMVVFFATAGARLDLGALSSGWVAILVLISARFVATWLSCRLGHRMAEDPPEVRRYAHLGFLPQAGLSIGLTAVAQQTLGNAGAGLATIAIAVIGINQIIGPVAYKWSLRRVREVSV